MLCLDAVRDYSSYAMVIPYSFFLPPVQLIPATVPGIPSLVVLDGLTAVLLGPLDEVLCDLSHLCYIFPVSGDSLISSNSLISR